MSEARTTWPEAIGGYLASLRAAGRPATTVGLRRAHVQRLAADVRCGPWDLTGEQLVTWAGGKQWAPETRRSVRSSLRGFYGWALVHGYVDRSPADALAPVRPTPPRPRPTPDAALEVALERARPRERLAIRLAVELGLRRGEVAVVHERDLVPDLAGWSLIVHGKGGRERLVPMPAGLAGAVRAACAEGGGWAFPGRIDGHMSAHTIGTYVSRLMPSGVSMHTLRHRFATRAWRASSDLLAVQQLLGHASPVTTQRYVDVDRDRLRTVMAAAA